MNTRRKSIVVGLILVGATLAWFLWRPAGSDAGPAVQMESEQQRNQPSLAVSSPNFGKDHRGPTLADQIHLAENRRVEEEGQLLAEELLEAAAKGQTEVFRRLADRLLYKYEGDPREILKRLGFLLAGSDNAMRYELARLYLQCGFEPKVAVAAMLDLVNARRPVAVVLDGERVDDLRLLAADLLGSYRIFSARDSIWQLYEKTGSRKLFSALAGLNEQRAASAILGVSKMPRELVDAAVFLGQLKSQEAQAALEEVFQQLEAAAVYRPDTAAIAWALYQTSGDWKYLDFLIANKSQPGDAYFLSSVQSPLVRTILEAAVYSDDPALAQASFLALYRNDRNSAAVKDYLRKFYDGTIRGGTVSLDLVYRVASNMNDPIIDGLAAEHDRLSGLSRWRFYNTYRADWPMVDLYSGRTSY